jgi:single-stranded DNA-specific DHH superfamily exonuclease
MYSLDETSVLVCNGDAIESKNLMGLMANKLASRYKKSTIIMKNFDNDFYSGSARGYHTEDFKTQCEKSNLFTKTMGHSNAFGVTIDKCNITKLYRYLQNLKVEPFSYLIEHIFESEDLSFIIVRDIAKYTYLWGCGVEAPKFMIKNILLRRESINICGCNLDTIKFISNGVDYIKFGCSKSEVQAFQNLGENTIVFVDAVGTFQENRFNGNKTYQVNVDELSYNFDEIPF